MKQKPQVYEIKDNLISIHKVGNVLEFKVMSSDIEFPSIWKPDMVSSPNDVFSIDARKNIIVGEFYPPYFFYNKYYVPLLLIHFNIS